MNKLRALLARLKSLFRRPAEPPHDPYADRLVLVPKRPRGRSGAVALEEPDDAR